MFRDDHQACRARRALLGRIHLEDLWTDEGPTDRAVELCEARGGPLSSGERVMLLAAFAFWNGRGHVTLDDAIGVLDREHVEVLCALWVAVSRGAAAVDAWIADVEARRVDRRAAAATLEARS